MVANPYESPQESRPAPNVPSLQRAIHLQGSLQFRDVLHTQALLLQRRWPYLLLCLVLYVGFVLALAHFQSTQAWWQNSFLLVGLVLGPCLLPLAIGFAVVRLRVDASRQRGLFAVTKSRLTDQGVETEGKVLSWSQFDRFAVSHRVVLLFLAGSQNHLIVARSKLVAPEDWHRLIDFLEHRLTPR